MLIATLVRCLTLLCKAYRDCRSLSCHNVHGWISRNQLDRDRWSRADRRYKGRRSSCRTSCPRTAKDLADIADKRRALVGFSDWRSSIVRLLRSYWRWRCPSPGTWRSAWRERYGFHDPEELIILLCSFELLVEDDVLAGEEVGRGQEVVLIRLLFIILFIECSLVLFQVFIEHVLAAELVPAAIVVDPHVREDAVLLENPVDLLLLAPDNIPVVVPGLLPLTILETIVDAVFEWGLEFYIGPRYLKRYGGFG